MSRKPQQLVGWALAVVGGLGALAAAIWLTGDAVTARFRQPQEQQIVAALLRQARTDATQAAVLAAEYDRQTQRTLGREARTALLVRCLIVATAVFLLGTKRLVALRNPQPTMPEQVITRCAATRRASTAPPGTSAEPVGPLLALGAEFAPDLNPVDEIVARHGRTPSATLPILQALQEHYRYLPTEALGRVCEISEITPAQLVSVASFYRGFRVAPLGEHVVTVCHGTACHVAGAVHVAEELRRQLQIAPERDTDAAGRFTVQSVPCLGCCTLAPVVQVDGVTHGRVQADEVGDLVISVPKLPGAHDALRCHPERKFQTPKSGIEIRIGLGSCCLANGSGAVRDALAAALRADGIDAVLKPVGCVGMCHQMPLVQVQGARQLPVRYRRVRPIEARVLVWRHCRPSGLRPRLRRALHGLSAPRLDPLAPHDSAVGAFLDRQVRIATEGAGEMDPLDLNEYMARGGFVGLANCRGHAPHELIELIRASDLRGRGGAGYPAADKWARVRQAPGTPKYVICNGDEGDPGAFMDRMLMESYPFRVLEGIAIAAYAVGATEGYFYIRAEYPLAVARVKAALQACEQHGLLKLPIHVVQGAGAFVCGEETALIATLEGRRGTPRLRPPHPAEAGLCGRPTLVNNVETFAVVPWIVRHGPAAFAGLGTATSKGTKVFALAGKVRRGGLIEVPMGITLREIVEGIGGGVREEPTAAGSRRRTFKAVQIGGPSGGCIPAELADTPVDYEALVRLGALMGSGGLVVLDDRDCMVDIARYFLTFTQDQSCGKCAPCRIGTRRMLEILERLCSGTGRTDDLVELEQLARAIGQSSLCGLGKTAPNPVLTTLRYFRSEYEAHVAGRCPAGKCRDLIAYMVTDACTGCTLCAQHCPVAAIEPRPYERHEIDAAKCTRCDACRLRCPEDAIRIVDARETTCRA